MKNQRPITSPFDVRDNRAMVSLGPLTSKRYCIYRCPFCYVNAGFASYASLNVQEIKNWLEHHRGAFDVIYISGDTDSFAHPRTDAGLALLRELLEFNVDLLFTTKAVFNVQQLNILSDISKSLAKREKLLFGCTSVAQLNFPHLEPHPIEPPLRRIEQLKIFKSLGIVSVLAMRPFLPIVPISEYLEIL